MHCLRCYGASPAVTHSKIELFIVLSNLTFLSGLGHVWGVRLAKLELTFPFDTLRDRGLCGEYRIWFELSSSCDGMGSPGGSWWWHWGEERGVMPRGHAETLSWMSRVSLGNYGCSSVTMAGDQVCGPRGLVTCPDVTPLSHELSLSLSHPSPAAQLFFVRHSLSRWQSPFTVTRSLLSEEKQARNKIYSTRVTLTAPCPACVKLREQWDMIVVSGWRDDAMIAFLLGWPVATHPYISLSTWIMRRQSSNKKGDYTSFMRMMETFLREEFRFY